MRDLRPRSVIVVYRHVVLRVVNSIVPQLATAPRIGSSAGADSPAVRWHTLLIFFSDLSKSSTFKDRSHGQAALPHDRHRYLDAGRPGGVGAGTARTAETARGRNSDQGGSSRRQPSRRAAADGQVPRASGRERPAR